LVLVHAIRPFTFVLRKWRANINNKSEKMFGRGQKAASTRETSPLFRHSFRSVEQRWKRLGEKPLRMNEDDAVIIALPYFFRVEQIKFDLSVYHPDTESADRSYKLFDEF
jgi:hypothetical protein